uniref:TROVE domain-containing protein n=1 Tax=Cyprinodon variegatus TaxID=28743 RepID=A0A3Q2D9P9_CYPVA
MRSLTLEKMDVASGEQQHLPTCGSSLTSNYCPPSLENKILMQASATNPQPWSSLFPTQPSSHSSLQPTSLSSTSSFLLSSSCSADSPLLSTHNKLLTTSSSLTPSLTSTVPSNPLVFSTLTGNLQVSGSYSFLKSNLSGEKKIDEEAEDEDDEEISEDMQSSFEETSVVQTPVFLICFSNQMFTYVAVYSRQELNIRITTNFLLALAASLNSTKPHVRRYFCAAVQLPSDWLEVCFSPSLPTCLKKAMVDKFKQFNEYQLAKYNTRKHRCKHNRQKPKRKLFICAQLQVEDGRVVVDKKQGEFSLKKLIKKLHIKEPADLVMAILGKKYPSDAKAFIHSGIKGVWDPDRAGQRMKLKEPQTWERLLSMEGNKAATWQKLIDSRSLPFMAMLRNLRNMITKGISEAHHKKILSRLTNKVQRSRQFPFRFLAAYKVIMELRALGKRHPQYQSLKGTVEPTRLCFLCRIEKILHFQRLYSVDLLDRYRKALETAVQISCSYNVPLLPGKTIILVMADTCSDESWSKKQDFCLPHDPDEQEDEEDQEEKGTRKHGGNEEAHNPLTPTVMGCHCGVLLRDPEYRLWVLATFSEFITERGSSRLLDHVENLDKLYNIPPPDGAKEKQISNNTMSLPAIPKLRWRGVRVFISSTFRDMHAERDVLVRSVFPELRRRAAAHCLHLQEVELRWGVTEEESERATELCLSEVCRSQMLVGILGERYGQVPPRPVLPDLPQYTGLSITEMEIRQFQALYPDSANQRMFSLPSCFLFRSVPVAWRSHFASESNEAEKKLTSLKRRLLDDGVKVTENYSCMWGGVVEGKPYLKKLEDFGNAVLEDLWVAVTKLFVNTALEVSEQEVLQGALQKQFFGRAKLLSNAVGKVEQVQNKGGMLVIEGGPGEGKTVFMVNLCLQDLLSEFHSTLGEMKKDKPLVVLVDGVDLVQDDKGQFSSDWIPQLLPQGVCLVLSISSNTPLLQTLVRKRGTVLFSLGQLSMPDKREIVQKELDVFGKKLSDSAFNNQVLFIHFRSFSILLELVIMGANCVVVFQLKETLQDLPQSLSLLVQYSLERLCIQYRTIPGLRLTLAALTVSNTGKVLQEFNGFLFICSCKCHAGAVGYSRRLYSSHHSKWPFPVKRQPNGSPLPSNSQQNPLQLQATVVTLAYLFTLTPSFH